MAVGSFLRPKLLVARILLSHHMSPDIDKCTIPKLKAQFFEGKLIKIA